MNRILRSARTLGLAVATGLTLSLVAAVAPAQAVPIGTLTFTDLVSQDSAFTVTTSGPCPVGATNFLITLSGGNIPSPSESPNLSGNTPGSSLSGGINDASFTATSQKNLLLFASGNGLPQLGDGNYTATLICRTALKGDSLGDYVGTFTISGNGATITPQIPGQGAFTTTTAVPSATTVAAGGTVTVAVTVSNNTAPATRPTGTVEIKEGATVRGTATLSNGAASIPVAGLATGAHQLVASYTSDAPASFQSSASTPFTVTVVPPAPALSAAPTITGTARVGGTLTCSTGTWTNASSIRVEFLKNNVAAQTSTTDRDIVLAASDLGKSVRCRVTASGAGGTAAPALTGAVTVSAGLAAKAVSKPKITPSKSVKVGKKLKAFRGSWSPSATYSYTYVWKRGSKVVKQGTTATTYKTTKKDKKKKITLTVVAKRAGYASGVATSAAVKVK